VDRQHFVAVADSDRRAVRLTSLPAAFNVYHLQGEAIVSDLAADLRQGYGRRERGSRTRDASG
jgi:hypothetical protein